MILSVTCNGAQVWGFLESSSVESVQKLFIKKLFCLPKNTPNYVLYLETFFEKLFFYTANLNINYILKTLSLPQYRLPNIFSRLVLNKNIIWSKEWKVLGSKNGLSVNFNSNDIDRMRTKLLSVVEGERASWCADCVGRARTSLYHQQYLRLDLGPELGDRCFVTDNADISAVSWIIKARAELIYLNFKPWILGNNNLCSLCNLKVNETVYHFIGQCPILRSPRFRWFKKTTLEINEYFDYLNGRDWRALVNYLKDAWKERWLLTEEFNF